MKGSAYTIIFSAALGTACALLLTAVAGFTKDYQEYNRKAEEALNILLALNVPLPDGASSADVVKATEQSITEKKQGDLTTYVYEVDGEVKATAMRFAGPGLWGPVKGFLALEPDEQTIRGLTFYEQEETPGLGGDIVTEGFRSRFVGKKIRDKDGNVGIVITKPDAAAEQNEVDGISGATMTCDKVQAMLNEAIRRNEALRRIVEEK